MLCASNDAHDVVVPLAPPEAAALGERIKVAGYDQPALQEVRTRACRGLGEMGAGGVHQIRASAYCVAGCAAVAHGLVCALLQVNPKKKVLERLFPDMRTNAEGVPCYKGVPFMTSKGPATSPVPNAAVA